MRKLLGTDVSATLARIADAVRHHRDAQADCERLLLPLEREDAERGSQLVETLRTYYACGLRVDRAAQRMFLHRNSVRYRLDRIRSLLHADLEQPATVTAFSVALALSADPSGRETQRDAV